jgi:hypothetical protein
MIVTPVLCQVVIVKHIDNYTGIVSVFFPEPVLDLRYNRMLVSERINAAMEFDAANNFWFKILKRTFSFHKVTNKIANHQFWVVTR